MKKVLLAAALLTPSILLAQSPFDGTWKVSFDQSKISTRPITFSLSQGMYRDASTVPSIQVKADGHDQHVNGHPYDAIAVKEMDTNTIQYIYKKEGKSIREASDTVSADGKTLTYTSISHPASSDQAITNKVILERIGTAPSGAHAASGSWRIRKVSASDNDVLDTYKLDGDVLTYSSPTGESWTAKSDGKYYPVTGSYSFDSVLIKQVSDRQIDANFKRGGKLIQSDSMKVSLDGKKLTTVAHSRLTGRVSTYVAEKQ